jgi:methyl coenzyme M reductase beta subunit
MRGRHIDTGHSAGISPELIAACVLLALVSGMFSLETSAKGTQAAINFIEFKEFPPLPYSPANIKI